MRTLIYVPMWHRGGNLEQLGINHATTDGPQRREFREKVYPLLWDQIGSFLNRFSIQTIYMDGYAENKVISSENNIIDAKESLESKLISDLIEKGGRLLPTENPAASAAHSVHFILSRAEEEAGVKNPLRYKSSSVIFAILREYYKDLGITKRDIDIIERLNNGNETYNPTYIRDKCVTYNIGKSLQEGETGVLFMGLVHDPTKYLKKLDNLRIILFDSSLYDLIRAHFGISK